LEPWDLSAATLSGRHTTRSANEYFSGLKKGNDLTGAWVRSFLFTVSGLLETATWAAG
jgi:hypothetical protein